MTQSQMQVEVPEDAAQAGATATGCTCDLSTNWRVTGSPDAVREGLEEIMESVSSCGTRRDLMDATEVVLAEVLNNVVEHAYAGRLDGWIDIGIVCKPEWLEVTVKDAGIPMPGGSLPAGKHQDLDVPMEELPEGGFGWMLIRTLTIDLAYRRDGEINKTTFKMLGEPDPAA